MEEYKYLIPEESIDAIMNNVSTLRKIENDLRRVFVEHDYLEVLMPSFEYVDLYNALDSGIEEEKMFQYINFEGKRVALRTDFTIPLARLYSSQKEIGVKRYCYFGNVYRKEKRHKGRSSEFFQAGIELLGQAGFAGDIECLHIIQETLSYLGLKDIKIEMSSAKFYKRLCELVDDTSFVDILKKRDLSSMKILIDRKGIQSPLKDLLIQLPRCFGDIAMLNQMIMMIQDQQLKDALTTAENVSPCILWIDEIEKGLAGSGNSGDGGVSTRMVGQFLFWLQECKKQVFVVATANDVSMLPSELLRRGRFDELFFVDLPTADERREILKIYMRKYLKLDFSGDFSDKIVAISEGFTAADLESTVRELAYRIIANADFRLSEDVIISTFNNVVPLSQTSPEKIEAIRDWGRERAVPASGKPIGVQEISQKSGPKMRRVLV